MMFTGSSDQLCSFLNNADLVVNLLPISTLCYLIIYVICDSLYGDRMYDLDFLLQRSCIRKFKFPNIDLDMEFGMYPVSIHSAHKPDSCKKVFRTNIRSDTYGIF